MENLSLKFKAVFDSIHEKSKIAIFYDTDPDGVTSGVLLAKAFKTKHCEIFLYPQLDRINPLPLELIKEMQKKKINYFFSTDIALEGFRDEVERISEFAEVVIIDHHEILGSISKGLLIKAQFLDKEVDPSQYCTAKMVFDLLSNIGEFSDNLRCWKWISCVGILADSNYTTYGDFVDKTLLDLGETIPEDVFASKFGKASSLLSRAESADDDMKKVFLALLYSDSVEELISSSINKNFKVGRELEKTIKNHMDFSSVEKDFIIIEISPIHKIGSKLSTILSHRFYPDKTVLVLSEMNDNSILISARRQDMKVDVKKVLAFCVMGLEDSNSGGHLPAAGASIRKNDRQIFKSRFQDSILRKNFLNN